MLCYFFFDISIFIADFEVLWSFLTDPPIILSMGSKVLSPYYNSRAVVNISASGSILALQGVRKGDAGLYRCSVAIQGDNPPSVVHTVRITDSTQSESEITTSIKSKSEIKDSIQSESEITNSTRSKSENTDSIQSESEISNSIQSESEITKKIQSKPEGPNKSGSESFIMPSESQNIISSQSVTISSPTTSYSVSTISALVGDDITLTCHTTAIHTPTIVWTRQVRWCQ